jgi:dTDP-4-amino-4,6-dideoxygalactose transaminase
MDGAWRVAGETGWVGTFSFFPSKNLGGYGDGGMMVTQDDATAERLRRLRLHGGARQYFHDEVGTNSRLDTLQAAVLLAKLPFLAQWSEGRRRNAEAYSAGLAGMAAVRTPVIDPANEHIFHQYTLQVDRRDELQAFLKARDIGTAVYYPLALHLQPCFAYLGYRPGTLPVTERAMHEVLSLPVYPELRPAQRDWVIESIRAFYG